MWFVAGAKEIDIAATLEHLRDQRPGMVQTKVLSVSPPGHRPIKGASLWPCSREEHGEGLVYREPQEHGEGLVYCEPHTNCSALAGLVHTGPAWVGARLGPQRSTDDSCNTSRCSHISSHRNSIHWLFPFTRFGGGGRMLYFCRNRLTINPRTLRRMF